MEHLLSAIVNLYEFFLFILKSFGDLVWKNPTAPIIAVAAFITYRSWRSQQALARAKNSIDLQNNFLASERIQKEMEHLVQVVLSSGMEELKRLADIKKREGCENKDLQALNCIRTVMNCFERIAIGINRDVYDEDLLFDSYATFVIEVNKGLSAYLDQKRDSNPHYYENFCSMAVDWEKRRTECDIGMLGSKQRPTSVQRKTSRIPFWRKRSK